MIQDLKNYIKRKLEENNISEEDKELFKDFVEWYGMNDEWFNENFEDYCIKNNINENFKKVEEEYYSNRFSDSLIDIPDYTFYQNILYERLGESLKTDNRIFKKLLDLIDGIDSIEENHKKYMIKIFYNSKFNKDSEEFKTLLNFGNYHIVTENKGKGFIQIEATLPEEIKDYKYDYVYHVTNRYMYEGIKKYGLLPKDKTVSVNHPSRIYLWSEEVEESRLKSFGRLNLKLYKLEHNLDLKNNEADLILLKIDLNKFEKYNNRGIKMKLYGDPLSSYNSALFTLEPIPTECIEEVKDFKFN